MIEKGLMVARIEIPHDLIAEFCRRHHIQRLALFGSVIRDDFTAESDVDVLVEFKPGHTPGLAFFAMQRELSETLGRQVDLNTAAWLSPYFRQEVLDEAEVIYVAP
jgi:predicted nucleotidyltransferase